jgi:hypothetical protein
VVGLLDPANELDNDEIIKALTLPDFVLYLA